MCFMCVCGRGLCSAPFHLLCVLYVWPSHLSVCLFFPARFEGKGPAHPCAWWPRVLGGFLAAVSWLLPPRLSAPLRSSTLASGAAVSCAWSNHVPPRTQASHGSVKHQGSLDILAHSMAFWDMCGGTSLCHPEERWRSLTREQQNACAFVWGSQKANVLNPCCSCKSLAGRFRVAVKRWWE